MKGAHAQDFIAEQPPQISCKCPEMPVQLLSRSPVIALDWGCSCQGLLGMDFEVGQLTVGPCYHYQVSHS